MSRQKWIAPRRSTRRRPGVTSIDPRVAPQRRGEPGLSDEIQALRMPVLRVSRWACSRMAAAVRPALAEQEPDALGQHHLRGDLNVLPRAVRAPPGRPQAGMRPRRLATRCRGCRPPPGHRPDRGPPGGFPRALGWLPAARPGGRATPRSDTAPCSLPSDRPSAPGAAPPRGTSRCTPGIARPRTGPVPRSEATVPRPRGRRMTLRISSDFHRVGQAPVHVVDQRHHGACSEYACAVPGSG